MPASVMVYRFEYFDRQANSLKISPDFATEEAIRQMGATILAGTGRSVPENEVAFSGIWKGPQR
jgi:hypothetical protein